MSTPLAEHYKGFDIAVQALRRETDRTTPPDAPRHYDVIVTISRSAGGAAGKTEMFGVPTPEPFDSPIAASKTGIEYARDLIDGKIEGQSVDLP